MMKDSTFGSKYKWTKDLNCEYYWVLMNMLSLFCVSSESLFFWELFEVVAFIKICVVCFSDYLYKSLWISKNSFSWYVPFGGNLSGVLHSRNIQWVIGMNVSLLEHTSNSIKFNSEFWDKHKIKSKNKPRYFKKERILL